MWTHREEMEFLTSDNHSLGPWPKARDTRLFSYHSRIFKVRLLLTPTDTDETGTGPISESSASQQINNIKLQADIDRCVASLLKRPPTKAAPTIFKVSTSTTFTVELRSWKADQKFITKMESSNMQVYPYSFKVSGQSSHKFFIEPKQATPPILSSSQSDGEKSLTGSHEHSDSDHQEEQKHITTTNQETSDIPKSSDPAVSEKINLQSSQSSHTVQSPPTPEPENDVPEAPTIEPETSDVPIVNNITVEDARNTENSLPDRVSVDDDVVCESKADDMAVSIPKAAVPITTEEPAQAKETSDIAETDSMQTASVYHTSTERSDPTSTQSTVPPETPVEANMPTLVPTFSEEAAPKTPENAEIEEHMEQTPPTVEAIPENTNAETREESVATPTNSEILKNMDRVSLKAADEVPSVDSLVEHSLAGHGSPRKRKSSSRGSRKASAESESGVAKTAGEKSGVPKKKSKKHNRKKGKRSATQESPDSGRCTSPKRVRMEVDDGVGMVDSVTNNSSRDTKAAGDKPRSGKSAASDQSGLGGDSLNKSQPAIATEAPPPAPEEPKSRRSCVIM